MTRKDYEAIAKEIRAYRTNTEGNPAHGCPATISDIVEILSGVFATDNSRFNADKFREATQ